MASRTTVASNDSRLKDLSLRISGDLRIWVKGNGKLKLESCTQSSQ